jgi:hypothetical protein
VDVEYVSDNGWHVIKRHPQTDPHRLTNRPISAYPLSRLIEIRVHICPVVTNRPPNVDEVPIVFIVKFPDLVVVLRIEIGIPGSFRWRRKAVVVDHFVRIDILII